MKKIITTTIATVILVGIVGCQKTDQSEPKTWNNAPDRLGSGLEDASVGPVKAVKATGKAIGDGVDAVGDAFTSDDKKE